MNHADPILPDLNPERLRYQSPLGDRYASRAMQEIWSDSRKFNTWRRIWLALAEAQHETGLPVTREQVEELRANLAVTEQDMVRAREYEAKLRHDVMAHVHAWGDRCPKARGIIHLGMTSQDVNDNCELLQLWGAWRLIEHKTHRVVIALGDFAAKWLATPTLGFTHFQPAQPTTVGRRAVQWAHDLLARYRADEAPNSPIPRLRGLRGATGTQASYLALFSGDSAKVRELEARFIHKLHDNEHRRKHSLESLDVAEYVRDHTLGPVAQTYPRVIDADAVCRLACTATVLHKIATDIRLLAHRKEIEEPFEAQQIGSSAMPYKRNPMRCERICALTRFVWNLTGNTFDTAATQWLERTLDDSANRRLVLPEAFLALDGALDLMLNVVSGLVVNEAVIRRNLMAELPFMATEAAMMEAVKLGRDRQQVHEAIRVHSMEAGRRVKQEGLDNDLIDRLRREPLLAGVDLDGAMDPMKHVGLAVPQTQEFLEMMVRPLRQEFPQVGAASDQPRV